MKQIANYLWRVVLAGVLLALVSIPAFQFLNRFGDVPTPEVPVGEMLAILVLRGVLVAAVLAYPTVRSRWSGIQLAVTLFVVYFGVGTFVSVGLAAITIPEVITLPLAVLFMAHGFLVAMAFSLLLVLVMGRMRGEPVGTESARLHLPVGEWLWKVALCAAVHVGLYVAAQLLERPLGFMQEFSAEHMALPPWQAVVLQVARPLFVISFVLPVLKMLRGGRYEAAWCTGLLLCVLGGIAPLMIPTELIETRVRVTLMVERGVSDFIFGFLVGYLLSRSPGER